MSYTGTRPGNALGVVFATTAGNGIKGGGSDQAFMETQANITTTYTISTNKNALSVGPIVINSDTQVILPAGQRWIIL